MPLDLGVADRSRRPVVVHGRPSALDPAGLLSVDDVPVLGRLLEGCREDGLLDLEAAHWRNALTMPSSFSRTSGWISPGRITAAIS
jgi:hypothetical protein